MENLFRGLFRPIEDVLGWILNTLHDDVGLTYGWAIVVLTVMVRILLLPLWLRQYKSMRRMRVLQPELKRIQKKYKGDNQRKQEAMMKLYKEKGVNPFGACLPMLPQIPIFISLFYLLRNFQLADGSDPSFMWVISDITASVSSMGFGAIILAAVYGTSQLISTELSTGPEQTNQVRWVFRMLPVGIVASLFMFDWPAGVVLYWASTNLWTAGQQLVFRQVLGLHVASAGEKAELSGGSDEDDGDALDEPDELEEPRVSAPAKRPPRRRRRGQTSVAVEDQDARTAPEAVIAPEGDEGTDDGGSGDEPPAAEQEPVAERKSGGTSATPRKRGSRGRKGQRKSGHGRRRSPRKRR